MNQRDGKYQPAENARNVTMMDVSTEYRVPAAYRSL